MQTKASHQYYLRGHVMAILLENLHSGSSSLSFLISRIFSGMVFKISSSIDCRARNDTQLSANQHTESVASFPGSTAQCFLALWKNTARVFPKCKKRWAVGAWERGYREGTMGECTLTGYSLLLTQWPQPIQ